MGTVPHLLTDYQKKQRVKIAKELLKMFPEYNQSKLADVVTGDEGRNDNFIILRQYKNKVIKYWHQYTAKGPLLQKTCQEGFANVVSVVVR